MVLHEVSSINFIAADIHGDEMEGESGVTRSIFDELQSWDNQRDEMEGESVVLLEVSLMNFIFRICREIK